MVMVVGWVDEMVRALGSYVLSPVGAGLGVCVALLVVVGFVVGWVRRLVGVVVSVFVLWVVAGVLSGLGLPVEQVVGDMVVFVGWLIHRWWLLLQ